MKRAGGKEGRGKQWTVGRGAHTRDLLCDSCDLARPHARLEGRVETTQLLGRAEGDVEETRTHRVGRIRIERSHFLVGLFLRNAREMRLERKLMVDAGEGSAVEVRAHSDLVCLIAVAD